MVYAFKNRAGHTVIVDDPSVSEIPDSYKQKALSEEDLNLFLEEQGVTSFQKTNDSGAAVGPRSGNPVRTDR